ncbi:MAG: leucyl aminopeptidase [bacterium]|nr:leucyl aminopeptidase [bacterium]
MKLTAKKPTGKFRKTDTVVFFLSEESIKKKDKILPAGFEFISNIIDLKSFKARAGETFFLPFIDMESVIICGMGKEEALSAESLRNAGASIVALCRDKNISTINILPPEVENLEQETVFEALAEGVSLANYSFYQYKAKDAEDRKPLLQKAIFHSNVEAASKKASEIERISENTLLCRDLINRNSESTTPEDVAAESKKLTEIEGVSCTVYGKKDIQKMNMGLLLAVNRGSKKPPQLVVLKYTGDPKSKTTTALVGKGITFDSGGMNLKPSGSMETMRLDMSGAATVLYTIKAAAELKLKKNIYAVIPLTENMLSNDAFRPGDVFKAYNGTTVEIGNTDAEGRLILADALSYTVDKLKPEYIIDLATLTGACVVTFGETVAALLSNDEELAESITAAGEKTGEKIWQLPLYSSYEENMKSDIADIRNIPTERNAGTITASIFLKRFIGETKWAHIDIAGTAWYSKPRGYRPKNATGYGVRLLVDLIKNLS